MKFVLAAYLIASLVTFAVFGWDKLAAKRGWRRVPEVWLQGLSLAGGFPGAAAAMQVFRHKRRKRSFVLVFALTVLPHAVGWASWLMQRR